MSTLTGDLAKVFSAINKKMGEDTIVLGSDITQTGGRLTSGSLAVDAVSYTHLTLPTIYSV